MFVVNVRRAPETHERRHRRHANTVIAQHAADLTSRCTIVLEVLECLARRDSVEGAVAERHARHVADDDRDRAPSLHVQRGFERVIDAGDLEATALQASGERPESNRAVEDAGPGRKALDLSHDPAEPVRVKRAEHLGLRAPFVGRHGSLRYRS